MRGLAQAIPGVVKPFRKDESLNTDRLWRSIFCHGGSAFPEMSFSTDSTFDVRGRRSGEAAKETHKRSLWAVPLDGIVRFSFKVFL